MKKETGSYIVELYDKYGHKEGWTYADNFLHGQQIAKEHEGVNNGNNAVVYRVLYNTIDKKDKY